MRRYVPGADDHEGPSEYNPEVDHERLQGKKPVRKDLFNLVRMAWWLPQYRDASTEEFISDVKDLLSRWPWYDEETTEY